ncbi:unnamed protein product [Brassicogethes aeneus]|uniref:Coiled-coil domain-containing protein 186 n=1 Tax=Brassicogethes aeneus TaxID=1431903 RepID=A0A9P0B1D8_BRAAE|nr:unnamed protein product [Brassicogethes aeneus]
MCDTNNISLEKCNEMPEATEVKNQEVLNTNLNENVSKFFGNPVSELKSNENTFEITDEEADNNPKKLLIENKTEINIKLNETICLQEKIIEQNSDNIKQLTEKCTHLEQVKKELEKKFDSAVKIKENAMKEKETTVIRYAVSEKNVLKEKQQKEAAEKKLKEIQKENEILQHKLQSMISEKSRICQMLDNKCYEHKTAQQDLERTKADLTALETKLKWSQNSLQGEIDAHKESQAKVESLTAKLQEVSDTIDSSKRDAENTVKAFHNSQENRANVLDQQVKEQHAALILLKHEKTDKDKQISTLQKELERLQTKQRDMLQENNHLSVKVQQLERDRLETEQKLSDLRGCADQQRQDVADLQVKSSQLEQFKLQLKHDQDQLVVCNEQISLIKQRNSELESDMEACRVREAELLLFTQQLTDKNVRLQSEFTTMETKVQQLTCEQTLLKRQIKEQETKAGMLSAKLSEERVKFTKENEDLSRKLSESLINLENYRQEAVDQKGENNVIKRKFELSFREINKELQHCRKKIEHFENAETTTSSNGSNTSLNVTSDRPTEILHPEQVKVIQPSDSSNVDRQALIEHIVKLQRISAKKSEKLDFLEEHVNTLVTELQKKSKLLQGYVLREQAGTLTSNSMDSNKAKLAKLNGVMASVYSSRVADENLTLELSLDINRKLQAVLEDALLKNITLKENVETLGFEIDRLNKLQS